MKPFALLAAAAAIAIAAPASAAPLVFKFTGPTSFNFTVDSNPTPSLVSGGTFYLFNVGSIPGQSGTVGMRFYGQLDGGGVRIFETATGSALYDFGGGTLFSGPSAAPVFSVGSYAVGNGYSLEIATPSVPEPATWALMIGGFGLAGTALRRRATVRYRAA